MEGETKKGQRGRPKCALSDLTVQMMAYLRELLKDGPKTSEEVRARVVERFGESALQNLKRTRIRLKVRRIRVGYGKGGHWEMALTSSSGRCSAGPKP